MSSVQDRKVCMGGVQEGLVFRIVNRSVLIMQEKCLVYSRIAVLCLLYRMMSRCVWVVQGRCLVYGKQRKDCTFCRYEKCLAVGMSPQLILSEEDKQRLFRKYRQGHWTNSQQGHFCNLQKPWFILFSPSFTEPSF